MPSKQQYQLITAVSGQPFHPRVPVGCVAASKWKIISGIDDCGMGDEILPSPTP